MSDAICLPVFVALIAVLLAIIRDVSRQIRD